MPGVFEKNFSELVPSQTGIEPLSFAIEEIHPTSAPYRIPGHLPADVADAFRQAEQNYRLRNKEAAISMYGRALETGLKWRFTGMKGMLNELIGALVIKKPLSEEISDWAHQVRLARKPALHDRDPVTDTNMEVARNFADAVLYAAITLPTDVAIRRNKPAESIRLSWEELGEAEET